MLKLKLFAGLFLFTTLASFLFASHAYAIDTISLTVIDRTRIRLNGINLTQTDFNNANADIKDFYNDAANLNQKLNTFYGGKDFKDSNIWDSNLNYKLTTNDAGSECTSEIKGFNTGDNNANVILSVPVGDGDCKSITTDNVPLGDAQKIRQAFAWDDETHIIAYQTNPRIVFEKTSAGVYSRVSEAGESCRDTITTIDFTNGEWVEQEHNLGGDRNDCDAKDSWGVGDAASEAVPILIGQLEKRSIPPGDGAASGGGGGGAGQDSNATCEVAWNNPLSWIMCPVFNGLADLTDWIFRNLVQPFLYTAPVSTDSSDPSYQAWSSFRVFANVILILAMLVVVFGQTIGGGAIDAYTAKKMLPRILAAAILINLSVYIVNFLIDFTNVLGQGIGDLLWAPFANGGGGSFQISMAATVTGAGTVAIMGLVGGAAIAGFLLGAVGGGGLFVAMTALIPAVLALLGVFATVVIRQGLLLFLIITSPIAFVLYVLPNTEQYFKKWWDLLFKTLMMYPIIIIIFTMADILSVMVLRSADVTTVVDNPATASISQGVAGLVAFTLQFLPLFLIPFAFKFAGSAITSIYGAISGGSQRVNKLSKKGAERQKQKHAVASYRNRARLFAKSDGLRNSNNRIARMGGRALGTSLIFGSNMQEEESEQNAFWSKKVQETKNNGNDAWIRAMFAMRDENGKVIEKTDAKGNVYVPTIGGGKVTVDDVHQADRVFGKNQHAFQAGLSYEMTKAADQGQVDSLLANFGNSAKAFGANSDEMQSIWIGSAFANQDANRQYKYYTHGLDEDGNATLKLNGLGLMKEVDEKQGSYASTMQNADTWTTMSDQVTKAQAALQSGDFSALGTDATQADAQEILQRGARIARSLESGGYQTTGANGQPITMPSSVGGGAPGRVKEEMEVFTGLFGPGDYQPESGLDRRGTTSRSGSPPNNTPPTPPIAPRTL